MPSSIQDRFESKKETLSFGFVALLLGLLVFGFISYRNRSKRNKLLAAKNAEIEKKKRDEQRKQAIFNKAYIDQELLRISKILSI